MKRRPREWFLYRYLEWPSDVVFGSNEGAKLRYAVHTKTSLKQNHLNEKDFVCVREVLPPKRKAR